MAPHLTLAEQDCLKYWPGSLQTKPCRNPRSIGEEETAARPRGTECDKREEGTEFDKREEKSIALRSSLKPP